MTIVSPAQPLRFAPALAFTAFLAVGLPPAVVRAQPAAKPAQQTAPAAQAEDSSDERLFAEVAKAVANGEADQLLAAADAALARTPADRRAAASKVATLLAKGDPPAALRAYGDWAGAAKREDAPLLGRVAGGVLRQLETSPLAELRARALEARARRGDPDARKLLGGRRTAKPETGDSWESTLALARLGDNDAAVEVARAVRDATGSRRAAALGSLRGVPSTPPVIDAIRAALQEGDDVVRDAAADAATGRSDDSLVGPLREVTKSARFTAPLRAAVALMRMADDTAKPRVDAALAAELADGRLLAARAYVGRPETTWIGRVEPLLKDPNVLYRVFAAELLLPVRAPEALRTLEPILGDENPVLRAEATRVVALAQTPPLGLLRAAMGDPNPWVRLHASEAVAALGTARAAPKGAPARR